MIKRFDFKIELTTHIRKLVKEGYLTAHPIYSNDGKNTYIETHYKINFGSIKPWENLGQIGGNIIVMLSLK